MRTVIASSLIAWLASVLGVLIMSQVAFASTHPLKCPKDTECSDGAECPDIRCHAEYCACELEQGLCLCVQCDTTGGGGGGGDDDPTDNSGDLPPQDDPDLDP